MSLKISDGCHLHHHDDDGGSTTGYEWLQASLEEHGYGDIPLQKLHPIVQLFRGADIYSFKCFALISSSSLDDLLGRLQLTEGLKTAVKGMHNDAQK